MDKKPQLIKGGSHTDERGTISFMNDFDMAEVKRFYCIKHHDTLTIRGWRGHQIEQRWFWVAKGAFEVSLVKIDNWEKPDPLLPQNHFKLMAEENSVLHIPAGYASCLQAIVADSEMIIFADYGIDHARNDDYLFSPNYFLNQSRHL